MRIISLVPAATETLCSIGGRELLVGRSHECDDPALAGLPALTRARVTATDPEQVDRQVRESREAGASLYDLDVQHLTELKPDLILTQQICSVCSIDRPTAERAAGELRAGGLSTEVLCLDPDSIEGVFDAMLLLGERIGRRAEAERAVTARRDRFFRAADLVTPYVDGFGVAFVEWVDPIFIAGHWTPQLIERAGGRDVLNPTAPVAGSGAGAGHQGAFRRAGPSRQVVWEALRGANPEVLIVSPCGVGLCDVDAHLGRLAARDGFSELPAVRAGRVYLVDGNAWFSRPGPGLVDAFEWLVSILNDRAGADAHRFDSIARCVGG